MQDEDKMLVRTPHLTPCYDCLRKPAVRRDDGQPSRCDECEELLRLAKEKVQP